MGRQTKNYRQTARSGSGNRGAQNYSQINRSEGWYGKIRGMFKVRGKGESK